MSKFYPSMPYRLQLIRVQMEKMAKSVGIPSTHVYAINGLKSGLMSCSMKSPGASTLMMNMVLPPLVPPLVHKDEDNPSPWM